MIPRRAPAARRHASKSGPMPHLILAMPDSHAPGFADQPLPAFLRRLQRHGRPDPACATPPATDSVARSNGRTGATPAPEDHAPRRAPLESQSRTEQA